MLELVTDNDQIVQTVTNDECTAYLAVHYQTVYFPRDGSLQRVKSFEYGLHTWKHGSITYGHTQVNKNPLRQWLAFLRSHGFLKES